jgi:hypothetical protein
MTNDQFRMTKRKGYLARAIEMLPSGPDPIGHLSLGFGHS